MCMLLFPFPHLINNTYPLTWKPDAKYQPDWSFVLAIGQKTKELIEIYIYIYILILVFISKFSKVGKWL